MPKLQKLRDIAFDRQHGRCWYCALPMLPSDHPGVRRCTAEHLLARVDGGKDTFDNVVAACWLCNSRRHRRKVPMGHEAYRSYVRRGFRRPGLPDIVQ